jgi:hypothetical protein
MCFSADYSLAAALVCTTMTLTLPRYLAPQKTLFYTAHGAFWSSMEWLQLLGYMDPKNRVVVYALMAHVMVQPVAHFCAAILVQYPRAQLAHGFRVHAKMLCLAAVSSALTSSRLVFGRIMIPCDDTFCSLLDDATPRCLIMSPHMTWSAPLGMLPTGLYGTLHHATFHFIFFTIAPFFVSPVFGVLSVLSTILAYNTTGIPRDPLSLSVWASVWCLTANIIGAGAPLLDMMIRRIERSRLRGDCARGPCKPPRT